MGNCSTKTYIPTIREKVYRWSGIVATASILFAIIILVLHYGWGMGWESYWVEVLYGWTMMGGGWSAGVSMVVKKKDKKDVEKSLASSNIAVTKAEKDLLDSLKDADTQVVTKEDKHLLSYTDSRKLTDLLNKLYLTTAFHPHRRERESSREH